MMDPQTLETFRLRLEAMLTDLTVTAGVKSDATATVQLDGSIGRLSRMDALQSQQMALALKTRQQQALQRVKNALASIHNGTYGRCKKCRGEIPLERLEVQPDAVVCLVCAAH